MKALILAAGMGKRLKDNTEDKPKALVKILEKPIIQWQIETLIKNGISDITIVLGYKSYMIKHFVEETFPEVIFHFLINNDYASTNSSYSWWLGKDNIKDDTYIHMNCDVLISNELLRKLIDYPQENVIIRFKSKDWKSRTEHMRLDKNNLMLEMKNNYFEGSVGKAAGVSKLSSELIGWVIPHLKEYISLGDKNQPFYKMLREAISEGKEIYALDSSDDFITEVNTVEELNEAISEVSEWKRTH